MAAIWLLRIRLKELFYASTLNDFSKSGISFKVIIATPVFSEPLALPEMIVCLQELPAFIALSKTLLSVLELKLL